jgi:hypothetical protein
MNYTAYWTQDYPQWQETLDELDELMLEYSDMKEATELINRIKGM